MDGWMGAWHPTLVFWRDLACLLYYVLAVWAMVRAAIAARPTERNKQE